MSFAELTQDNEEFAKKITIQDIQSLSSSEQKYSVYPYFKFDIAKKFESHMVVIEPGGTMDGEPRGSNANEYITVFDGTLTLILGDERVVVKKDESLKFNGNTFHKYLNEHETTMRMNMIIHY